MSPSSRMGSSSRMTLGSYLFSVSPMCTISLTPASLAARFASLGISIPMISKAGETMRALIPQITSRFSEATWIVLSRSMLAGLKMSGVVARPVRQMCKKQIISVSLPGITCLGMPPKVSQPALPASTMVVTPARTPPRSAFTPLPLTPSYTWVCRSMSPGVTIFPATSITRVASSAGMFDATRAIFPSSTATSLRPFRF